MGICPSQLACCCTRKRDGYEVLQGETYDVPPSDNRPDLLQHERRVDSSRKSSQQASDDEPTKPQASDSRRGQNPPQVDVRSPGQASPSIPVRGASSSTSGRGTSQSIPVQRESQNTLGKQASLSAPSRLNEEGLCLSSDFESSPDESVLLTSSSPIVAGSEMRSYTPHSAPQENKLTSTPERQGILQATSSLTPTLLTIPSYLPVLSATSPVARVSFDDVSFISMTQLQTIEECEGSESDSTELDPARNSSTETSFTSVDGKISSVKSQRPLIDFTDTEDGAYENTELDSAGSTSTEKSFTSDESKISVAEVHGPLINLADDKEEKVAKELDAGKEITDVHGSSSHDFVGTGTDSLDGIVNVNDSETEADLPKDSFHEAQPIDDQPSLSNTAYVTEDKSTLKEDHLDLFKRTDSREEASDVSAGTEVGATGQERTGEVVRRTWVIGDHQVEMEIVGDELYVDFEGEERLLARLTWNLTNQSTLPPGKLHESTEPLSGSIAKHKQEIQKLEAEIKEENQRGELELAELQKGVDRVKAIADRLGNRLSEVSARQGAGGTERQRLVQQMQEEQKAAEERLETFRQQLEKEQSSRQQRLAEARQACEEDTKLQESFQTSAFKFVLDKGRERKLQNSPMKMHDHKLQEVATHLYLKFKVRLLGVSTNLAVFVEFPVAIRNAITKEEQAIQSLLKGFLPDHIKPDVAWAEMTSCCQETSRMKLACDPMVGVTPGLKVMERSTVESAVRQEEMKNAPLDATPRRLFMTKPITESDTDKLGPGILAIVATENGHLVMVDERNFMVKVTSVSNPEETRGVRLGAKPLTLALLHNELVAVTTEHKFVNMVDVSENLMVTSRVQTSRQYIGVASVVYDDTLIVSCENDDDGPASVDVITRAGHVIRTVIDSSLLPELTEPEYLCVTGGEVLISDSGTSAIFRVNLATGRVIARLTHSELDAPCQIAADREGNVYVSSTGSQCVLVTSADGEWRRLLDGSEDGDEAREHPIAVCVWDGRVFVSWHSFDSYSVVIGYDLCEHDSMRPVYV